MKNNETLKMFESNSAQRKYSENYAQETQSRRGSITVPMQINEDSNRYLIMPIGSAVSTNLS